MIAIGVVDWDFDILLESCKTPRNLGKKKPHLIRFDVRCCLKSPNEGPRDMTDQVNGPRQPGQLGINAEFLSNIQAGHSLRVAIGDLSRAR